MEELGHNAERQVGFPDTKLDHKIFTVAENVNWKILEVCIGWDGARDLPLLVYEEVLLRIVYTMYSWSHVNRIYRVHNECKIDTNLFYSNDIENGV